LWEKQIIETPRYSASHFPHCEYHAINSTLAFYARAFAIPFPMIKNQIKREVEARI